MTTPNETQVLADIAAAQARGEDPFGDGDTAVIEEPADPQDEKAGADDKPANAPPAEPVGTPQAAPSLDAADDAPLLDQPQAFKTDMPADYKEQRAELVKEKAGVMKKLIDGEIDADEFAVQEARISDALEDLTAQRIRSETLHEANVQTQAQYQQRELQKLIRDTKGEVDYTNDTKAQHQFDFAISALTQDPEDADRDYSEILADAHKVVLALRGVTSKGQQVAEAVKSRAPEGKPPVTLRNLPVASTPNANGDMLDQLGRLSGEAYEKAYDKLTPAQKRTLLDEA